MTLSRPLLSRARGRADYEADRAVTLRQRPADLVERLPGFAALP